VKHKLWTAAPHFIVMTVLFSVVTWKRVCDPGTNLHVVMLGGLGL